MKSVLRAPLYRRKGGLVPGAKSFSSSGFLHSKVRGVIQCVTYRVWMNSSIIWCTYWLAFVSESGQWWIINLSHVCYSLSDAPGCGRGCLWQNDRVTFICLMQTVIPKVNNMGMTAILNCISMQISQPDYSNNVTTHYYFELLGLGAALTSSYRL